MLEVNDFGYFSKSGYFCQSIYCCSKCEGKTKQKFREEYKGKHLRSQEFFHKVNQSYPLPWGVSIIN